MAQYIPYTRDTFPKNRIVWVRHTRDYNFHCMVTKLSSDRVYVDPANGLTYDEFLEYYEEIDGTPCGVVEDPKIKDTCSPSKPESQHKTFLPKGYKMGYVPWTLLTVPQNILNSVIYCGPSEYVVYCTTDTAGLYVYTKNKPKEIELIHWKELQTYCTYISHGNYVPCGSIKVVRTDGSPVDLRDMEAETSVSEPDPIDYNEHTTVTDCDCGWGDTCDWEDECRDSDK